MSLIKRILDWLRPYPGKPANIDSFDLYKPVDRQIYSYWDGQKEVKADPLFLYKRMMKVGPELNIDMKVAHSASQDAGKAHDSMIAKIRDIFAVKPFDQGGLTEIESIELLDHYLIYCSDVKKNGSPSVTSPEETFPVTPPTSSELHPTLNSSGSGLTAGGPSTDKLPQPPSVPVSPSA